MNDPGTRARPSSLSPELLLAAIVDSSDDAIISKDLTGVVTSWNKSAQRIFGYSSEEMVGSSIIRLLPPELAGEEGTILSRLQRGERVEHYETVRVCKDGRRITVSLTISPIRDPSGTIIGASKIARDITAQKEAMAQLADANERLKQANHVKSEFISTLSHELRTPLTAMVGWVQLLKDGVTPEELSQGLEIIDRNVRTQTHLVNDLLDMSRIDSGKMSLDLQRIDVPAVIEAVLESSRPAAQAKGIRLEANYSSVEGEVVADRNRLQQIIWNLVTNAIKFTQKGGTIKIFLGHVDASIEISVSDDGIGIPQDQLKSVFDRFNQADSSVTRRHGGLGLGLSIVKHLTELHGGTVHARSGGLGQGSTFSVQLPLVMSPRTPQSVQTQERHDTLDDAMLDADLNGVKVLVVDDEPDGAAAVRLIVKRRGAQVEVAGSVAEGLAAFTKFQPDVVLSDIGMPDHDGYEFISRLRELPGGRSVPAVALTALARSEDRTRALRSGFQMHVAKPVEPAELVAVVRNLADLRRVAQGRERL